MHFNKELIRKSLQCIGISGEIYVCEVKTPDNKFSKKVGFLVEDGKMENDPETLRLISQHFELAEKAIEKMIRRQRLDEMKNESDEFRANNIV